MKFQETTNFTMEDKILLIMSSVISELRGQKKVRNYCKNCGEYGHVNMISNDCPIKIMEKNIIRNRLKNLVLDMDCLIKYQNDDLFEKLSKILEISVNKCKTLYFEIPIDELMKQTMDIDNYISTIGKTTCFECNCILLDNANCKIWKNNTMCDKCWYSHKQERDMLWKSIVDFKKVECSICRKEKVCEGDRFHYDHMNMFDKSDSICSMVDKGFCITDILLEIDKCQILCIQCHCIVTQIEHSLCFTRIKKNLTRKYNNEDISEEEYKKEQDRYEVLYKNKMNFIYEKLRNSNMYNVNK